MPDTATTATAEEAPMTVVLIEAGDSFAPRTRKSTADALAALKPSLDAVRQSPDKVFTIAQGISVEKASSLVSLLNDRYDLKWTFGSRTADDGKGGIVQARYSERPENVRKVRQNKPRATVNGTGSGSGGKGTPRRK